MGEGMHDDDAKLLRETREALLIVGAKLDAFNLRLDDDRVRMVRMEALCEIQRVRAAAFEPLIPAVFGAPGQVPGLVERTANLELRAITWPNVAALAAFCGVLSSIAATMTALFARDIW